MAVTSKAAFFFSLWTLFSMCASAPPSRDLFDIPKSPSTSTQLSPGKEDFGNSMWDDDDDEGVFDLDGDSWLNQQPETLNSWSIQSPKPPDFDEDDDENLIGDESDDSEEEEEEEQENEENPSEFLLVPASSVDKRDLKVRHTGHSPGGELDDSNFLERPDDVNQDKNENYDLLSFPETDGGETGPSDDADEKDSDDNDIFGEEDDDDSKKMFEDRVFLF